MAVIETDYLVVGAGAAGMGFTDVLLTHSPHDVLLVDRRFRPGGHWHDAYPFVRLHLPSALYGVASRPLGTGARIADGPEAGWYERATAAEVCDYFARVLDERFLPSGRVRFLGLHDYVPAPAGGHRVVSRLTGEAYDVRVRRKLVDATYLEAPVPANHVPPFGVADGARVVPVGGLVDGAGGADRYVVLGAGKTGIDACLWLLDQGVPADRVTWVRPRDPWLLDRASLQPFERVGAALEGLALDLEALAAATSPSDLMRRLEGCGRLLRIDPAVEPAMYHCATVSRHELAQLRQVRDVVRLGRVRRVEPDRLVLDEGERVVGGSPLYVDCTAAGLRRPPVRPVFEPDRVTIQSVRACSPTFNAALIGYVEATRDDVAEQNRLCPAQQYPDTAEDWLRTMAASLRTAATWRTAPDLLAWAEGCRTNHLGGVAAYADDPLVQQARSRVAAGIGPAMARLAELLEPEPVPLP